ncbi:hypothetical protein D3C80_1259380 [compost metagenome]
MMSFTKKLNEAVEELKSNPEIYVAHYAVSPPDLEAITSVESELGYPLDDSITDFYKECGGIQLLWINKNNDSFDKIKKQIESFEKPLDAFTYFGQNMPPDGSIMIPSIETVFLKDPEVSVSEGEFEDYDMLSDWENIVIQPFDLFGHSKDVAFILNKTSNPPMLLGSDNQACYTDSYVIYFKEYLDLLLKLKGARSRSKFLDSYSSDGIEGAVNADDIEKIDAPSYINQIL